MIPVFEPLLESDDIAAVVAALQRGEISGSFGRAITDFEQAFAEYCGCRHGIAVNSGTAALHVAVHAAGIGPGSEVLVSASTNVATGLAAYHNGAVPVAVDSEEETWNLDLDLIERLVSPRTKAIIPVHLFGHPVDMDRLMPLAERLGLVVIEDCAEAHGATVRGRRVGSFGHLNCFSFYANKIITTGEGGMITTNDDRLAERCRLLRNLAFTKPRFWHEEAGYNFRMPGLQAALGLAQLHKIERILAEKRRVAHTYNRLLQDVPGLRLPAEAPWATNVYWMYALTVEPEFGVSRDELMLQLQRDGIDTRTFFCSMGSQPVFAKQPGARIVPTPVADRLWATGLYLPSAPGLNDEQMSRVAASIRKQCRAEPAAL